MILPFPRTRGAAGDRALGGQKRSNLWVALEELCWIRKHLPRRRRRGMRNKWQRSTQATCTRIEGGGPHPSDSVSRGQSWVSASRNNCRQRQTDPYRIPSTVHIRFHILMAFSNATHFNYNWFLNSPPNMLWLRWPRCDCKHFGNLAEGKLNC